MKMIGIVAVLAFLCISAVAQNNLTLNQTATYSKNGIAQTISAFSGATSLSGNGLMQNVQAISTNILGDVIAIGSITAQGFVSLKNIGPLFTQTNAPQTNIIQVGRIDGAGAFLPFLEIDTNRTTAAWCVTNSIRARAIGTNSIYLNVVITDR